MADGPTRLRAERNRRYQDKRAALVAKALAPEPTEDGGVLMRAPLVKGLTSAVVRLDRAVREYDERVHVHLRFGPYTEVPVEEQDLYQEAVLSLRWSLTEMHASARDAAEVLMAALMPPSGDEPRPGAAGG